MKKTAAAVVKAMDRLRKIRERRTVLTPYGEVRLKGYPDPGEVMDELRHVYAAGVRAGQRKKGN